MSQAFRHWVITGFEASFRQLVAIARRRGATEEAAEDLAQEAYLRLIQAGPATVQHPRGYLFRTAANLQIDEQRRGRAAPFIHTADIEQHAAADPAPGRGAAVDGAAGATPPA
jgi:DNA-directed RNA polymerase specialized sigma24 family protein